MVIIPLSLLVVIVLAFAAIFIFIVVVIVVTIIVTTFVSTLYIGELVEVMQLDDFPPDSSLCVRDTDTVQVGIRESGLHNEAQVVACLSEPCQVLAGAQVAQPTAEVGKQSVCTHVL